MSDALNIIGYMMMSLPFLALLVGMWIKEGSIMAPIKVFILTLLVASLISVGAYLTKL